MKLGVLFSGGKDSTFAAWTAKKYGQEISCLISIISKKEDSYMFHTPSISKVKFQSKVMNTSLIMKETLGEKEIELEDLKKAIKKAKNEYGIGGIVTGAVESVYQASRVQKICNELKLECFNPLWQKDQFELLEDLIKNNFKVIIVGVFAYPLGKDFLGRKIDKKFVLEIKELNNKLGINPAGEGGEFETYVLNCPLFIRELKIKGFKDFGERNSWRRELEII